MRIGNWGYSPWGGASELAHGGSPGGSARLVNNTTPELLAAGVWLLERQAGVEGASTKSWSTISWGGSVTPFGKHRRVGFRSYEYANTEAQRTH